MNPQARSLRQLLKYPIEPTPFQGRRVMRLGKKFWLTVGLIYSVLITLAVVVWRTK